MSLLAPYKRCHGKDSALPPGYDCKVVVGDVCFFVFRAVLSTTSKYFNAMFCWSSVNGKRSCPTSGRGERATKSSRGEDCGNATQAVTAAHSSTTEVYSIPDVDPDAFEELLKAVNPPCDHPIDEGNLVVLAIQADLFDIAFLREKCLKVLKEMEPSLKKLVMIDTLMSEAPGSLDNFKDEASKVMNKLFRSPIARSPGPRLENALSERLSEFMMTWVKHTVQTESEAMVHLPRTQDLVIFDALECEVSLAEFFVTLAFADLSQVLKRVLNAYNEHSSFPVCVDCALCLRVARRINGTRRVAEICSADNWEDYDEDGVKLDINSLGDPDKKTERLAFVPNALTVFVPPLPEAWRAAVYYSGCNTTHGIPEFDRKVIHDINMDYPDFLTIKVGDPGNGEQPKILGGFRVDCQVTTMTQVVAAVLSMFDPDNVFDPEVSSKINVDEIAPSLISKTLELVVFEEKTPTQWSYLQSWNRSLEQMGVTTGDILYLEKKCDSHFPIGATQEDTTLVIGKEREARHCISPFYFFPALLTLEQLES
jgi:hypothetical protein